MKITIECPNDTDLISMTLIRLTPGKTLVTSGVYNLNNGTNIFFDKSGKSTQSEQEDGANEETD